jgi:signal transduction histidine kinase
VGIGLALSKAILNNQNASITVESKEKIGTQFIIKFYKVIV